MALHEIPAEILRDVLLNIDGEISAACPYAFLLTESGEASLEPHRKWLEEQGLLDTAADQDGRLALIPSLRRALDIVARPIRRILVGEVTPQATRRAVYVSDGAEVVVAMFDQERCLLSDPADLKEFRSALVTAIGPAKGKSVPTPLVLPPAVLRLLGAVSGSGSIGSDDGAGLAAAKPALAGWPMSRSDLEARLGSLLEDKGAGAEAVKGLIADQILAATDGMVDLHPSFRPWHEAITSGHALEIQRLEYPQGGLQDAQPPVRAYFWGPVGERCLMWPAGDETGEILLSRPTARDLKTVVGYLVGYAELT
jgi:hypothetical protein